jgi:hypothetical protein
MRYGLRRAHMPKDGFPFIAFEWRTPGGDVLRCQADIDAQRALFNACKTLSERLVA